MSARYNYEIVNQSNNRCQISLERKGEAHINVKTLRKKADSNILSSSLEISNLIKYRKKKINRFYFKNLIGLSVESPIHAEIVANSPLL